jgi:DNA-3-methyladenine glycosylase
MFQSAGHAYVFRIYGNYHCLNVVTDQEGIASSVLICALELETLPPGSIRSRNPSLIALQPDQENSFVP